MEEMIEVEKGEILRIIMTSIKSLIVFLAIAYGIIKIAAYVFAITVGEVLTFIIMAFIFLLMIVLV